MRQYLLNWAQKDMERAAILFECALNNRSGMLAPLPWEARGAARLVGEQAGEAFKLAEEAQALYDWIDQIKRIEP